MIQKDRMFKMVINDPRLVEDYKFKPDEYPDCSSGLDSDNAVVAAIAMIVDGISADLAKGKSIEEKSLYQKVFNHLNNNVIYAD